MNAWAFEMLVATALLMAVVMLLRGPAARIFGPRVAYALWALPALRVAMPSLPGWRLFCVPVFHLTGRHIGVGLVDPISAARLAADDAPSPPLLSLTMPVQTETIHWQAMLIAAWLGGALLWFAWQMLRYRRFLQQALRSSILLTSECGIDVLVTPEVDGPAAAGVIIRRIFLPADFTTRYTPSERRLALLHEGAHHDRRDILANFVALGVLALHWWNPLAHRAYKVFRADQELACDATVLTDVEGADRQAYGSAVLKSVSARMPGVACSLSHKDQIKRRLQAMAAPQISARRMWAGAVIATTAIGTGLIASGSGHATVVDPNTYLSSSQIGKIRAEADDAPRESHRAAEEALLSAREGRRMAKDAQRDSMRERSAAQRDFARVRSEAQFEETDARAEAAKTRTEAANTIAASRLGMQQGGAHRRNGEAAQQIAAVRQSMAARCADQGRTVSPDLDWSRLALCGDTGASIAARIKGDVRHQLAREGVE